MKIPRDLDGKDLIRALRNLGYEQTRQSGSHLRLTRYSFQNEHHVTVPLHSPLRVGTLNAILGDVATQLGVSKDEVVRRIRA